MPDVGQRRTGNSAGPVRVLVAEDIETNRVLVKRLLERRGHAVTTVNDGRTAVQALGADAYDVVLLDIQMPGMDGFEAARTIRDPGSPVLRHDVPLIALTAHSSADDRERCLATGMNGYLAKPIVIEELYRLVEAFAPAAAAGAGRPVEAAPGAESAIDQARARLTAKYFGDRELAETILRAFVDESGDLLRNVREAEATQDFTALSRHAHALKSAAATAGFEGLREYAHRLEQAAGAGAPDAIARQCAMIAEELARIHRSAAAGRKRDTVG